MYTDNHLRYVAASIVKLFKHREAITGLKRVYATKLLSHFTARFEPICDEGPNSNNSDANDAVPSTGMDTVAKAMRGVPLRGDSAVSVLGKNRDDQQMFDEPHHGNGVLDSLSQQATQSVHQQQAC